MNYNNEIKGIIEKYKNKRYRIRIEDLNSVIKDIDNLLYDGIHPNEKGCRKIGEFWSQIIDKYLSIYLNK